MISDEATVNQSGALEYAARRPVLWQRLLWWAVVVTWFYPVGLVGMLYATWLVAWMTLGRPPVASLDDPKSIGMWVNVFYGLTWVMILGFPAAAAGGIASTGRYGIVRGWRSWVIVVLLMGLGLAWAGAVGVLRWDPLDVMNWFLD